MLLYVFTIDHRKVTEKAFKSTWVIIIGSFWCILCVQNTALISLCREFTVSLSLVVEVDFTAKTRSLHNKSLKSTVDLLCKLRVFAVKRPELLFSEFICFQ